MEKYNHPTAFVIFGGTGNLAQTKLLPALLDLYIQNVLPDTFVIIGLSRKEMTDEVYQIFVNESINLKGHHHSEEDILRFCKHLRYISGNFDDAAAYEKIKHAVQTFDDEIGQCSNKLFYLAVPPNIYSEIFHKLKDSNAMALCDGVGSWSRLLVEKPFGSDLETAQDLERQLHELFGEEQIYRIDHYLAKDAIENIISLRFANSILINSWNKNDIESIAVRLLENKDVSTRGAFYDGIGAIRDVGQNHMLQMVALFTMQKVNVHDVVSVRTARAEVLRSLLSQRQIKLTRGQYEGFTETKGVSSDSQTETYFKIETEMQSADWKGVILTLESGKVLDRSVTEAVITFRASDNCNCDAEDGLHTHSNVLTITFSPEQQIRLAMWVKKPGFNFILEKRELEIVNKEGADVRSPEAYEHVLHDCIMGDQTRFVSGEEVIAEWEFINPILEEIMKSPLHVYKKGSKTLHFD